MGYSREQLRSALVAADKAGDTAAAQRIAAQIRQMDSQGQGKDTRETSFWQGFFEAATPYAANAQRAMDYVNPANYVARQVVNAGSRAVTGGSVMPEPAEQVRLRKQQMANAPRRGSTAGRLVGNIVGSAPTLAIPGSSLWALAGQGAAAGAMGTEDPTNIKELGMNAALGAFTAPISYAASNGVARMVGGRTAKTGPQAVRDANLRTLNEAGITLTPGQLGGPRSIRQFNEDKILGSAPADFIVGSARGKQQNQLRFAMANAVLEPIGERLPAGTHVAHDAIATVQGKVYGAYDDALNNIAVNVDGDLTRELGTIRQEALRLAGPDGAAQVGANIDRIVERLAQGNLTGKALRETMSDLRGLASKNAASGVGDGLWAIDDAISNAIERQNGGEALARFQNARTSVSLLKRLEDAASRPGVVNAEFGPTAMKSAVDRRGYGTTTPKLAAGEAPLQKLSNAAADIMRNQTANSGTVPRAAALSLLTGAPAAAAHFNPVVAAPIAASTLGYIPGIAEIIQQMTLASRPKVLQSAGAAIQNASPYIGRLSAAPIAGLLGQ